MKINSFFFFILLQNETSCVLDNFPRFVLRYSNVSEKIILWLSDDVIG